MRDRLVSHHRETFSSDRLCVAVQGGQSLDDLQDHIVALFSRVPRGEAGPPRGATAGTAYPGRPRVCWLNAVGSEHLLM